MATVKMKVLAAGLKSATAQVEYIMDGYRLGVETVPELALAVMLGDWSDAVEIVGKEYVREVD